MSVLVAYATKHGATRGIAEFIAQKLVAWGQEAEAKEVRSVGDPSRYQAFVIGSALYYFSWRPEAIRFVRRNRELLASRPVWLFSSGPIGTKTTDDHGRDVREGAGPKQLAELKEAIHPRDHKVFFGALDKSSFGLVERIIYALPAGRELLTVGDFRDWPNVDAWTEGIARELALAQASAGAPIPAL